jgi:hypothetical protein
MSEPKLNQSIRKKIWIDLDNSPHVPFFVPIIKELESRGHSVFLTTRDCFQVCGLADSYNLQYKLIGKHYGKNKALKMIGMLFRTLQMIPFVIGQKPDLALSHGSRSQLLIASIFRIPSVLLDDYEHSKYPPLTKPKWLIIPKIVFDSMGKKDGKNIFKYSGIKEHVYVPDFEPDPGILEELGIQENEIVVAVRPPANEAHYQNPESEILFKETIDFLQKTQSLRIVLLPRNKKQELEIRNYWPELFNNGVIIIPEHVIDGLNLIWFSDLVISGGGTMNREAAALGVPVYSIFRGEIGAIDKYLAKKGELTFIESIGDITTKICIVRRDKSTKVNCVKTETKQNIVDCITSIMITESGSV